MPRFGWLSTPRTFRGGPPPCGASEAVPVEIYDPTTGTFQPNGTTPGMADSAARLDSNRILLTGTVGTPASGEALGTWSVIYDLLSGRFEKTSSPRAWNAAATALDDGWVLFAGGGDPASGGGWPPAPVRWAEIYK
jgi:hypothetical protein